MTLLGFGGAALASLQFAPKLPFLFADNLRVIPGEVTADWIAAQMCFHISKELDRYRSIPLQDCGPERIIGMDGLHRMISYQLPIFDPAAMTMPREEFSLKFIEGTAEKIADSILFYKPTKCGRMPRPSLASGIESRFACDKTTGLQLRYVRGWIPEFLRDCSGPLLHRFDVLVGA